MQNIISQIAWDTFASTKNYQNRKVTFGAGLKLNNISKKIDSFILSSDIGWDFFYQKLKFSIGPEYNYYLKYGKQLYSISIKTGYYENTFVLGGGFGFNRIESFSIIADYLFSTDYLTRFSDSGHKGYNHRISLKFSF